MEEKYFEDAMRIGSTLLLIIFYTTLLFCQPLPIDIPYGRMVIDDRHSDLLIKSEVERQTLHVDSIESEAGYEFEQLDVGAVANSEIDNMTDGYSISPYISYSISSMDFVFQGRLLPASSVGAFYNGKKWRGVSFYTEQAYIEYRNIVSQKLNMKLRAGRFYSKYGPGRRGQLFFSTGSRPLDKIQLAFSHKSGVTLFSTVAQLDRIENANRYLSIHRVELLRNKLAVGFNESILYGGQNRNLELAYLNPLSPFYVEQINGPDLEGNVIVSMDIRVTLSNFQVYGELLIDDFQFDNKEQEDLEPNEYGLLYGVELSRDRYYIGLEQILLTNRTYKTARDLEWYTHRNNPIGFTEGSDLAVTNFIWRWYVNPWWEISMEYENRLMGEGGMSKSWDTPWMDASILIMDGYSEPFPTGVVEKTNMATIEIARTLRGANWLALGLGYEMMKNKNNVSGSDKNTVVFNIAYQWNLNRRFAL